MRFAGDSRYNVIDSLAMHSINQNPAVERRAACLTNQKADGMFCGKFRNEILMPKKLLY